MASDPDEVKNTRALGVGAIWRSSSAKRLGRLVGERVERRVGAERADLGRDGVGHLGAAVTDRVVPQAGHAIDQLAAVLVPHQRPFPALDADEALSRGLGVGVEERCGHVTTVPNRLESSRVAHTLPRPDGAEEVWVLPTATTTTQPQSPPPVVQLVGRRLSSTSTPARLSVLRAVFVVLAVIFAVAGAFGINQRANAIDDVRTASQQLIALQDIQVRIVHADAIASSSYLRSGQEDPAQRTAYLDEIATAGDGLVAVSGAATDADLGQLSEASRLLGSYVGLVEQARANNRQGFPVGATYQRQANGIVSNTDPDTPDIVSSLRAVEASQRDQINDSLATAHRAGVWLHAHRVGCC